MTRKPPHIIVVGAGIVGASVAYHLARRNARVTLLEGATLPAHGVTEKSFAWITAGQGVQASHLNLRKQAVAEWHRLEAELAGKLQIDWSGALSWYKDGAEAERLAKKAGSAGQQVRLFSREEVSRLEPHLKLVPDQALFAQNEGALNPVVTTQLLVAAAREAGTEVQLDTQVLSLTTNGSRVTGVVTVDGSLTTDLVILATGTGTKALAQPLGFLLPVAASPAVLMKFYTERRFIHRIVSNPLMEIRAASDNLLLAAADYLDESEEYGPQAIAVRTLEAIKEQWYDSKQTRLIDVRVGERPMPQDGLPIIGQAPGISGLYLTVMHSGVTLAALAGRLSASDILSSQEEGLLAAYRPSRFS